MKKSICFLIALLLFLNPSGKIFWNSTRNVFALEWPVDVSVSSEAAIVMDADSGAVLYGKNIHETYFPASITKILTALVIVENCDLNEELTFSYSSIHDVEDNSSNAGFAVGDTITVRDALYALLLKSANEAANALAEHCSGSVEEFCKLMNQKAQSLGCKNSNFKNPSGLNDANHYVSAYDYALISRAAFDNVLFLEIDGTTFYDLPKSKNYPEGQTIYTHHAMLKRSNSLYYPGIFGGKTGYTTLAGNTLVTGAKRDGLRLIVVVLNSKKTHYSDTKALLDFGFSNFKNVDIEEADPDFLSVMEDVNLIKDKSRALVMETGKSVTLPKEAQTTKLHKKISYETEDLNHPKAIARVSYFFDDRVIGTTYLLSNLSEEQRHIASDVKTERSKESSAVTQTQTPQNTVSKNTASSESVSETKQVKSVASDMRGFFLEKWNISDVIEKYLYVVYVIATLLIIAILLLLLKLILYIRDRIVIGRKRRIRNARLKAKYGRRLSDEQKK